METPYKVSVLFLLSVIFIVGCTPPLVKEAMVPEASQKQIVVSGKTVSVGAVTGGKKTVQGGLPWIDDSSFQDALTTALDRSGLFQKVVIEPQGNYLISAEIVSQKMSGTFDNSIDLFIHYELVDKVDTKILWKNNFFSHYELSVSDVFDGAKRRRRLQETAVRDNLSQFLDQLRSFLEAQ